MHASFPRICARPLFLLAFCVLLSVAPGLADAADISNGVDFWCKWPTAWINRTEDLGNDLVRQYVSPDGNAFIEVYAARGNNPGLKVLADSMERGVLDNGGTYFQNRMKSTTTTLAGNIQGILREYNGLFNGIRLHAFALFAHGNGGNVAVLGVFPENMTDTFWETVYQCVVSLRFSPPPGMAPAQVAVRSCNDILGAWHWFTGSTVEIKPNGVIPGQGHSWACLDGSRGRYRIVWSDGTWIDTLTLSADGNRLQGTNQINNRVWAERISKAKPTVPVDTVQSTGPSATTNSARKVAGNMGAQWKLAHGSVNTKTPSWNAEWELKTTRPLTISCLDPSANKGQQRYLVQILDRYGQQLLYKTEVRTQSQIRILPGIYRIKVLPLDGYASWRCTWE